MPEADSAAALRARNRFPPPAVLTHLHRVELLNAWQLKVFRREMEAATIALARSDLDADVAAGVWCAPSYDLPDVFRRAEEISATRSAGLGTRSLDILHVAAALTLGLRVFVTADHRQASLASAVGLRVVELGRRRTRGR